MSMQLNKTEKTIKAYQRGDIGQAAFPANSKWFFCCPNCAEIMYMSLYLVHEEADHTLTVTPNVFCSVCLVKFHINHSHIEYLTRA